MCEGAIPFMTKRRKLILAVAVLFALNIAAIALAQAARAETYQRGDSGGTVREIQMLLKEWGYYDGSVDGQVFPKHERAHGGRQGRPRHARGAGHPVRQLYPGRGRLRRAGAAGEADLCRGQGGAVRRPGGGGRGGPEPGRAPVLPQHHLGGHIPAGCVQLHAGRAVGRARGGQRLSGGARGSGRV